MNKEKIIIDTDPGVDDALAIAFAIKASMPIEAITTVYGNSTVKNSNLNTLTILELLKQDIPVYSGAKSSMVGKTILATSHGQDGLGGFRLSTDLSIKDETALDFYKRILSDTPEGEIIIVAIGPTTNIGLLVRDNPELFAKVRQIIIMGGVFGERGNITDYAEFNVYNDPRALDLILKSGHQNITIVPADICRQVTFTKEVFNQIDNQDLAQGLAKISELYIDYYSNDEKYGGFEGGVMYDLLAIAILVDPTLFTLTEAKVKVEIEDDKRYGLTEIVDGEPNCHVVNAVDVERLKDKYVEVMNK